MGRAAQMTLLLTDNSADYRRSLRLYLELEDYRVEEAESAEQAREKLASVPVDLALVDLRLHDDQDTYDISGLGVAKVAAGWGIPCIVMTAFPTVEVTRLALRSRGLEPLAVDLIPKADGPQALLDAIRVVLTPGRGQPEEMGRGLTIDLEQGMVWLQGAPVELSEYQYRLLAHLYERKGAVCGPQELLRAIYGEDLSQVEVSIDRRLERLVARVREKIEDDPAAPQYLATVAGRGYRLLIEE